MIAYLRQHHDTNLHQDYLDHINTFGKFALKNIPTNTLKTELAGLDPAKVERYKQMDFSKAPPIVMGDGYILDGYHRAVAAKELGIPTIRAYVGIKDQQGMSEGKYNANPATYNLPRRPLNVPELIKRGAIFVVDPHGPNGWEPDAEGFSLVTLYNVAKGGWPAEAGEHLKPSMYKAAELGLNRQGPGTMLYDGKYNQILWSIKKLGIPDEVAFLDTVKENFADGRVKGKSRPGRVKRSGASCNGSVTDLRARAKRASGEKARMYHWCANMKSGKKNESEMDEGWKQNVAAGVLGAGMALGGGTAQDDTDVFNKKLTPAEIQQIQTKANLTQRYYNELVRRAKEDGRIMDRRTLNMLKAKAEDAAALSIQQQPQAPQAKSTLPGTQPSEIRRSSNYKNFESVKK